MHHGVKPFLAPDLPRLFGLSGTEVDSARKTGDGLCGFTLHGLPLVGHL